ncbi:MAG: hypothetical protein EXX96DRAFT_546915 [Benjaminiella poitrasii]|nr:MAG: hypothetical protein EXX96DRAFT_546915 [Benjaminiella poitrasii]
MNSSESISPLDLLVFDATEQNILNVENEETLNLWANAQFTYNMQSFNNSDQQSSSSSPEQSVITSIDSPSSITYECLANYLDYELPQKHVLNQPQQQPKITTNKVQHPQLLLPKISPSTTIEELTKVLMLPSPLSYFTVNNTIIPISSSSSITMPNKASSIKQSKERTMAEEDKRKRNTTASARFRIKKKQKEQMLEKRVREMTDKSTGLTTRVHELESEIKFLRGLLIEKKNYSFDKENAMLASKVEA